MIRPSPALMASASRGAFRPTQARLAAKPVFQPHVGRFTVESISKWVPTLVLWGGAGAGAVTLFFSGVPLFVHDVLIKVPGLGSYYEDKTPDSDKPF